MRRKRSFVSIGLLVLVLLSAAFWGGLASNRGSVSLSTTNLYAPTPVIQGDSPVFAGAAEATSTTAAASGSGYYLDKEPGAYEGVSGAAGADRSLAPHGPSAGGSGPAVGEGAGSSSTSGSAAEAPTPAMGDLPAAQQSYSTHRNAQLQPPMTAGKIDDNADFSSYLDYLRGYQGPEVHRVDVSQRIFLRVVDNSQHPVAGARVILFDGAGPVFNGETVSDGSILFFPAAAGASQARSFRAEVTRGQAKAEAQGISAGTTPSEVVLKGATDNTGPVNLDLVFLLDSTGSMGDEIDRIKDTVDTIATRIQQLPGSTTPRFGLVTYRDRGDEYVTRAWDFTGSIDAFKANLANVQAGGGGDEPESVSAGLEDAIHLPGWAENSTGRHLRMIVLVGDAPPHLDYANDYEYTSLLREATSAGIKIFPIGASGLDDQGEYIFRQFAQMTQGQFVFLTYANGISGAPGVETTHHVSNYTVSDLDSLVVSLVAGEIANQEGKSTGYSQPVPAPVGAALPEPTPLPDMVTSLVVAANRWVGAAISWLVVLGLPLVYLAGWRRRRAIGADFQRDLSSVEFRLQPPETPVAARVEPSEEDLPIPGGEPSEDWTEGGEQDYADSTHQDTIALPFLPRELVSSHRES